MRRMRRPSTGWLTGSLLVIDRHKPKKGDWSCWKNNSRERQLLSLPLVHWHGERRSSSRSSSRNADLIILAWKSEDTGRVSATLTGSQLSVGETGKQESIALRTHSLSLSLSLSLSHSFEAPPKLLRPDPVQTPSALASRASEADRKAALDPCRSTVSAARQRREYRETTKQRVGASEGRLRAPGIPRGRTE